MTIACVWKAFAADITDIRRVHSKTVTYRTMIVLLFRSIYGLVIAIVIVIVIIISLNLD